MDVLNEMHPTPGNIYIRCSNSESGHYSWEWWGYHAEYTHIHSKKMSWDARKATVRETTDLGPTRFGSGWPLTCLETILRTVNCTNCLGNKPQKQKPKKTNGPQTSKTGRPHNNNDGHRSPKTTKKTNEHQTNRTRNDSALAPPVAPWARQSVVIRKRYCPRLHK